MPEVKVLIGSALDKLKELPDESVHCCVTSPPYWGLRDYSRCSCSVGYHTTVSTPAEDRLTPNMGGGPTEKSLQPRKPDPDCPVCAGTGKIMGLTQVWGGDPACQHDWVTAPPRRSRSTKDVRNPDSIQAGSLGSQHDLTPTNFCKKCNAWKGQLGLEPTPEMYVEHLVLIAREIRRVLRSDGTFWLNVGDTYNAGRSGGWAGGKHGASRPEIAPEQSGVNAPGLKPKDLCLIPSRLALALQSDGWYVRKDVIWHKPNPMPESVSDRPTTAHEYIWLLTKSPDYFYDQDAIREPYAFNRWGGALKKSFKDSKFLKPENKGQGAGGESLTARDMDCYPNPVGRNIRDVWTIQTEPYPDAHFATFPEEIPEKCIKAGTSERGCCAKCGAPYERVTEFSRWSPMWGERSKKNEDRNDQVAPKLMNKDVTTVGWKPTCECVPQPLEPLAPPEVAPSSLDRFGTGDAGVHRKIGQNYQEWLEKHPKETVGWNRTCECAGETKPCVVLDPFAGSGTTGWVARRLGRDAILVEINPEYAELIRKRAFSDVPDLLRFGEDGQQ